MRLVRPAALIGALALALALGACSTTTVHKNADPADAANQGYVSGDGTTKTWPVSARKGPLTLEGTSFEGKQVDVADWRGHVVLLNTWYANCAPCRAEAPDLAKIAGDYAAKGVQVLGINGTDDTGAAQAFQSHFGVPYPSIKDTDGAAVAALQGTVPLNAVPTTVFLDANGKVAARILGLADPSTVRTELDSLLAEAGSTGPSPSGSATS